MLNPFPALLDFALIAPFLIRLVAGLIFVDLGFLKLAREKDRWQKLYSTFLRFGGLVAFVAFVEIAGGILLFIGMFTQVAALALGVLAFANLYLEFKNEAFVKRDLVFHLMLFTMVISLLFSGAGFLAFDMPL